MNDGFGSKNDLRHCLVWRLECGDKPTFSPEGRLSAGSRLFHSRISANLILGHEDVMTTFRSCGHVHPDRQRQVMEGLRQKKATGR